MPRPAAKHRTAPVARNDQEKHAEGEEEGEGMSIKLYRSATKEVSLPRSGLVATMQGTGVAVSLKLEQVEFVV